LHILFLSSGNANRGHFCFHKNTVFSAGITDNLPSYYSQQQLDTLFVSHTGISQIIYDTSDTHQFDPTISPFWYRIHGLKFPRRGNISRPSITLKLYQIKTILTFVSVLHTVNITIPTTVYLGIKPQTLKDNQCCSHPASHTRELWLQQCSSTIIDQGATMNGGTRNIPNAILWHTYTTRAWYSIT